MNKAQAIQKAGGTSEALASILSEKKAITPSAVRMWGDSIPDVWLYRLKELKPHWFRKGK